MRMHTLKHNVENEQGDSEKEVDAGQGHDSKVSIRCLVGVEVFCRSHLGVDFSDLSHIPDCMEVGYVESLNPADEQRMKFLPP